MSALTWVPRGQEARIVEAILQPAQKLTNPNAWNVLANVLRARPRAAAHLAEIDTSFRMPRDVRGQIAYPGSAEQLMERMARLARGEVDAYGTAMGEYGPALSPLRMLLNPNVIADETKIGPTAVHELTHVSQMLGQPQRKAAFSSTADTGYWGNPMEVLARAAEYPGASYHDKLARALQDVLTQDPSQLEPAVSTLQGFPEFARFDWDRVMDAVLRGVR